MGVQKLKYAGFWVRVLAYLIDFVILLFAQFTILSLFGESSIGSAGAMNYGVNASTDDPLLSLILLIIAIGYFVAFESSATQATPGKMALGLIVTDMDGRRISVLRALGRYFAKFLSGLILFIGYIMVAFTDRKQGLHDLLASTLVVKGKPGEVGYNAETFA